MGTPSVKEAKQDLSLRNGQRLLLRPSPHIHCGQNVSTVMWAVVLSLVPATVASLYLFGWGAAQVIIASTLGAVLSEALCLRLRGKPIELVDGSAVVTGLLLALTLPPGLPVWMSLLGGFIAIALGKQVFGGLGANPFNPALVARVFLVISFPEYMTRWIAPFDAASSATPLVQATSIGQDGLRYLLGTHAGCLGETSAIALLAGGAYLIVRGLIDWRLPTAILGTVTVVSLMFGADPLFQLLTGGLLLGAFFMATDWVSSPITRSGRVYYGIGIGLLTMIIRLWGGYPEGVSFAILFMNALTPLINLVTRPRPQTTSVRETSTPEGRKMLTRILVTMGVVAAFSGVVLAIFFGAMNPRIEVRRQQEVEEGFEAIFPQAAAFEPVDLSERLPKRVNSPVYVVKGADGEDLGVAYVTTPAGFQGDITLAVGIDAQGLQVVGVEVLAHTETAGLGSKIEDEAYLQQFADKSLADDFAVAKDIDGISGATVSSAAVANGVRDSARAVLAALADEEIAEEAEVDVVAGATPVNQE